MGTKPYPQVIAQRVGPVIRFASSVFLLAIATQSLAASNGRQAVARQPDIVGIHASAAAMAGRESFRGEDAGDLVKRWWQWLYSIPLGVDPVTDATGGLNCGINQEGSTWFLAAPIAAPVSRTCAIPYGRSILTPVVTYLDDWPCPPEFNFNPAPNQSLEDFLRSDVGSFIDPVASPSVTLDGRPVRVRRVASKLFGFTGAANLVQFDACITGSPQLGVADGYWAFIEPPARGRHTLVISASAPNVQITYTLDVR